MARTFHPGMGQAVAERTILRKYRPDGKLCRHDEPGQWEEWADVANRVANGNANLIGWPDPGLMESTCEYESFKTHIENATILMSGRHLQHGDESQPGRNMEVFTNCATAPSSFFSYYLLLNGSGVGRSYDDSMMLVDWDDAPAVRCVLAHDHPDFNYSAHESARDARHKYGDASDSVIWHRVGDSREGWAKALEVVEVMAYEKVHRAKLVILDFSGVRPEGTSIDGMQGRPSCGPVPTMNAFAKAMTLRGGGLPRWKQALYIDHYFAESVLVGGARRAARIATKHWRDESILDFIDIKRPIEFRGMAMDEVRAIRAESKPDPFLWSANMSVMVDADFWAAVTPFHNKDAGFWFESHATRVFTSATRNSYGDGTGEPAFINAHKLNHNLDGIDKQRDFLRLGSAKYRPSRSAHIYLNVLFDQALALGYFIVNPCAEKVIAPWGGFCVIGDVVPYHAETLDEAEDAFRVTARALIRVNTMDSVYKDEVDRTNRIGVGMTGIFEFAWKFFGFGFRDLIDEARSIEFWRAIARFKRAVQDEARSYSIRLGHTPPHTDTTIKPAGTTSKLFGLTEGAHLPAMPFYLRWVQFISDSPQVEQYRQAGYPVRELVTYPNTTIVGFPTTLVISDMGLGDKLVTAGDATPEEQYRWLMLLEKYWLRGVDEDGQPLAEDTGSQVSYTLKYDPAVVPYGEYAATVIRYQPLVKCCSVMPQEDASSHEYLPEQSVTKAEYEAISATIRQTVDEDVDLVHVECPGGACPVDFEK